MRLRRNATAIAGGLMLAALLGCGESTPKRSVDARTEVLNFYAVDAPAVALLRPQPAEEVVELNRVAGQLPIWSDLRRLALGPLLAAGLDREKLRRLVQPQDEIEGVEAAALALGAATPDDLADRRPLLVLATDQDELLARLLKRSDEAGALRSVGHLDEATLYRNPLASYAERDGVLVSAPRPADVRAAIKRRDGDSDQQLDEDVVNAALQMLDEAGPLALYGTVPQLLGEPDVEQLFAGTTWVESADDVAASVQAVGETVEIEVVVNLERDLEPAERPFEEEPQSLRVAISGVGSLSGIGSASSDEVRLQLETAR